MSTAPTSAPTAQRWIDPAQVLTASAPDARLAGQGYAAGAWFTCQPVPAPLWGLTVGPAVLGIRGGGLAVVPWLVADGAQLLAGTFAAPHLLDRAEVYAVWCVTGPAPTPTPAERAFSF